MERWDDLRFVLAVCRGGSLSEAARSLKVDPSTVTRRLQALEEDMGVRLFDRLRHGVELTPTGELLLQAAEDMEVRALALERQVVGGEAEIGGTVRLTLPELFALRV